MPLENVITKEECILLNEVLETKSPSACFSLVATDFEDKFTVPQGAGESPFQGKDAQQHRNSWLMPRMARRMTRNNKYHVSQWRQDVPVTPSECAKLREQLVEAMGSSEGLDHLPAACQKM